MIVGIVDPGDHHAPANIDARRFGARERIDIRRRADHHDAMVAYGEGLDIRSRVLAGEHSPIQEHHIRRWWLADPERDQI